MTEPFLARDDEIHRVRGILEQVSVGSGGLDTGYLVLIHGLGGIGKTTLIEQYKRVVGGEPAASCLSECAITSEAFIQTTIVLPTRGHPRRGDH